MLSPAEGRVGGSRDVGRSESSNWREPYLEMPAL